METLTLEAKTRDTEVKSNVVLRDGFVPAEFYGRGVKNKSLMVETKSFKKVYRVAGRNTVVELNVDGKEKSSVLIHDVQFHPVRGTVIHIDFTNVSMTEELHTEIPLKFVGLSFAVKDLGGTLVPHLSELEVKCLPKDLVHTIEVSIDSLVDFTTYIRVKDVKVPAGITVLNNPEDVVVNAVPPRKEEEEVKPVAPDAAAVPVVGEEKKEGEAAAAASEKSSDKKA